MPARPASTHLSKEIKNKKISNKKSIRLAMPARNTSTHLYKKSKKEKN